MENEGKPIISKMFKYIENGYQPNEWDEHLESVPENFISFKNLILVDTGDVDIHGNPIDASRISNTRPRSLGIIFRKVEDKIEIKILNQYEKMVSHVEANADDISWAEIKYYGTSDAYYSVELYGIVHSSGDTIRRGAEEFIDRWLAK